MNIFKKKRSNQGRSEPGNKKRACTPSDQLNPDQGHALIRLARQTICKRLGIAYEDSERSRGAFYGESFIEDTSPLDETVFKENRGVFVTLHKQGQLRGCIGSLEASAPMKVSVEENAINAAFKDPRFSPLTVAEYDQIDVEISILTEPKPLEYRDAEDLLAKLRPGVDGVVLKKGWAKATFLPQVWDSLPKPESFLSQLCQKAGLPAKDWKTGDLEILTYQVQYFGET
ncbi:MAG: AmmeMemoRadiSam system protein A [Desulfobacteraceae bacterium]|nr:MAG: AmmeMemoRadiSam system protein A [Desulfobacteraceae bacterium]